jgi:hypothetical protein
MIAHPQRDGAGELADELLAIHRLGGVAGVESGAREKAGTALGAGVQAAEVERVVADEAGLLIMTGLWEDFCPGFLPDGGAGLAEFCLQAVKASLTALSEKLGLFSADAEALALRQFMVKEHTAEAIAEYARCGDVAVLGK